MISIKDVAARAKVSAGTVSKVLKGYTNISEETKKNVMQAVNELGYVPNSAASTLSSKGKKKLAIYIYINDKFQQIDEINMLYLMGALDRCRELGIETVTVYNETLERLQHDTCLSYFSSLSADSVIVFGLNKDDRMMLDMLESPRFNFVVVDAPIVRENTSCIYIDQQKAQYDVANQVIAEGDRVIYFSGKKNGYVSEMRLEGIRQLQKDKNFELTVIDGEFSEAIAYKKTLELAEQYDCIVCASDMMAIGAKKACKELGIYVKISGFDGIRLMGYVGSAIPTVRQNFYNIGSRCVDEIMRLREGESGQEVIMPYEIDRISYRSVIK